MVWAIVPPQSSGEFLLYGDFIGWDEALEKYFNETMPLDRKAEFENGVSSYLLYVTLKFLYKCGTKPYSDKPTLTPIESHECPERFETQRKHGSLGSMLLLSDSLLAVDEKLKSIVEQLDPGVHAFSPIELITRKGEKYAATYFVMVVGRYLESFLREKSDSAGWRIDGGRGYYFIGADTKKEVAGLTFSKASIGNAHVWRERYESLGRIFVSDAFVAEAEKAGLRLPKHFRAMEI